MREVDLSDRALRADPYPTYARLRTHAPVTVGNQPIYLLAPTRAALVRTLGADQSQELDTR